MEKIAEHFNEDLIDINEITDYLLFGNKTCNIENEYLDTEKRKLNISKQKFSDYTNRLLLDDDEIFISKKNNIENEVMQKDNTHRIFKIHQGNNK